MGGRGRGKRNHGETGFEAWGGYMAAKKAKLENQFENTSGKNSDGMFNSVSIFVNGLTNPSASELKEIMLQNGGTYHHYYKSHGANPTTHIIASNLPHAKIKEHQNKLVVRPEWISASLKAGKVLDYREYLLLPPVSPLLCCLAATSSSKAGSDVEPTLFGAESDDEASSGGEPTEREPTPAGGSSRSPVKRAGEPDFLREYYQKSRLHHISEMKAVFKEYVSELQDRPTDGFPERARLLDWCRQQPDSEPDPDDDLLPADGSVMAHVDMDCFFVSVALRSRPELLGRPVAVTHSRGGAKPAARAGEDRAAETALMQRRRGDDGCWPARAAPHGSMAEIASCSYEARAAGVRNGMFMGEALQRCADLQTVPYDFAAYREVALQLYGLVCGLTRTVQAVSCDELLADCSQLLRETGVAPLRLAAYIRQAVHRQTDCTASVGMGPNILLARLATAAAKPDGQLHVTAAGAADFIANRLVADLPGVGRATARQLHGLGARTCGQLQQLELALLQRQLGPRTGQQLHDFCRGVDRRAVVSRAPRKTISAEVNYGVRMTDAAEMTAFADELCAELQARMTAAEFLADSVTVKVMVRAAEAPVDSAKFMGHGLCDTVSRSARLAAPTGALAPLRREVAALLTALHVPPADVRGLGVQAGRATSTCASSVRPPPSTTARPTAYTADQVARLLGVAEPARLPPPLPAEPQFCGTAEPVLIRRLVAEWLTSGPAPEPDDVAALTTYLTALVEARLLQPAYGLLTLMARRLRTAGAPWRAALADITGAVQTRVQALHSGRLQLPPPPPPPPPPPQPG